MTSQNKLTRVQVKHDAYPEDPRKEYDPMCEIVEAGHRKGWSRDTIVSDIIANTKGYQAAEALAIAADVDPPDISDPDIIAQWVELLKPEMIIKEFSIDSCKYVAHTTPARCEKLGVKWEDAEKAMDCEIETFTMWAEGDTWGVVVSEAEPVEDDEEPEWEETDAVWGFYGTERDNGMRDHVPEHLWPLLDKALENPCYA